MLGEKTIALIHAHVRVGTIHDDLDDLVFDADVIEAILDPAGQQKKAKEIVIKVAARLRRHLGNPRFKRLSERLEQLKARHEAGQLHSIAFLKELLDLARDLVAAEQETPPAEDEDAAGPRSPRCSRRYATPQPRSLSSAWSRTSTRSCASCAYPTKLPRLLSMRNARVCILMGWSVRHDGFFPITRNAQWKRSISPRTTRVDSSAACGAGAPDGAATWASRWPRTRDPAATKPKTPRRLEPLPDQPKTRRRVENRNRGDAGSAAVAVLVPAGTTAAQPGKVRAAARDAVSAADKAVAAGSEPAPR